MSEAAPTKTADEWGAEYAERSGTTLAALRKYGQVVAPCGCDYEGCEGYGKMNLETFAEDLRKSLDRWEWDPAKGADWGPDGKVIEDRREFVAAWEMYWTAKNG
jgi:hypothetical protein